MSNLRMQLCKIIYIYDLEPSLQLPELLFWNHVLEYIVGQFVNAAHNEVLVLGLHEYSHLFVFQLDWILLCQALPDVAQILDILALGVGLVNHTLPIVVCKPLGTILLVNLATFLFEDFTDEVIFAASRLTPHPNSTQAVMGVGFH